MKQQFTGIQLLRFLAAMLVVVMHITQARSVHILGTGTGNYWANGSAGVDIFFVISGFVMASSTNHAARGIAAGWEFMRRRIVRIVPLYWFYTLLKAGMLLALPGLASRSSFDFQHLMASLMFVPSTSPWSSIEPLLPVGWTLNFEMFFYAVFATAIIFGRSRIMWCAAAFASVHVLHYFFPNVVALSFYARSIIIEFLLGMVLAYAVSAPWFRIRPALGVLAVAAGFLLLFIGGSTVEESSVLRLTHWGGGGMLLLLGVIALESKIAASYLARRVAFLGDASYSIYLSHAFVVPAFVLLLKALGLTNGATVMVVSAIATIVVGCISYVALERPLGLWCKKLISPKPSRKVAPT